MDCTASIDTLMRQAPITAEMYFHTLKHDLPDVNDTALAILALASAVDFHGAVTAAIHTDNREDASTRALDDARQTQRAKEKAA